MYRRTPTSTSQSTTILKNEAENVYTRNFNTRIAMNQTGSATENLDQPQATYTKKPHSNANSTEHLNRDWRFWTIIASLCITSLLTAIESTVTSTALPTISKTLGSREEYVWFVNAIFLSRYVSFEHCSYPLVKLANHITVPLSSLSLASWQMCLAAVGPVYPP